MKNKSITTYKIIDKYFYNNDDFKNSDIEDIKEHLYYLIDNQDEFLIDLLIDTALDLDQIEEALKVVESCLNCDKPFNEFEQSQGFKYCSSKCQFLDSDIDYKRNN
jgi:hypothetical protein